jgi:hypothetical protein
LAQTPTRVEAIDAALTAANEQMHAQGSVVPMIIAHTGEAIMSFPLAMTTPLQKQLTAQLVGSEMRKYDTKIYAVMTEGWLAFPKPGDDPNALPPASERPDRIEGLVLAASDLAGDTLETYRTMRNGRISFPSPACADPIRMLTGNGHRDLRSHPAHMH